MNVLHIAKSGLLTTVQDLGRWGHQASGVPVAGAMDPVSHRMANALVGNGPRAATLEITLTGPEVVFTDERSFAVAGAAFDVLLDGRPVTEDGANAAHAGARLSFGRRRRGARAYLAISGGIDVPLVLGSRATHLLSRMGGFCGRALQAGDRLPLGAAPPLSRRAARRASVLEAAPDRGASVRVLPGHHAKHFPADAFARLQSAPYTIATDSDRMGFRLRGTTIPHEPGLSMISDATPLGVLQVLPSGQPVLLMADRQTTGGYPVLATVIAADIGLAGQLAPGDTISFAACSRREALAALIAQERALMGVEGALRP
jgi:antagonist of KipI